jgi:lipopolysaccharide/colanic/teichoic acid biosynthesis glycosyltransferase
MATEAGPPIPLHSYPLSRRSAIRATEGKRHSRPWPRVEDTFDATRRPAYDAAKRVLDLVLASLLLAISLPLLGATAAFLWLQQRGAVFEREPRLGHRLRQFGLLKFCIPAASLPAQAPAGVRLLEAGSRPRPSFLGRVLSRTGLEYLPQLTNVLTGELSLVGPRAPSVRELEGLAVEQGLRLSVKPGITGLWRVSRRGVLPFAESFRLDLEYVERRNLVLDLAILFWTVVPRPRR